MRYFAGLDVSLEQTSVCVVDGSGAVVNEAKVASDPDALAAALWALGYDFERVGLEAGPLSEWLYGGLSARGFAVVCLETRRVKSALSAMVNKTDRKDAEGLAQLLRIGWYRAVHVKTAASQELRCLLVSRKLLVDKRRDVENQIRGSLKVFGLKVGKTTPRDFARRVRELVVERPSVAAVVEALLSVRAALLAAYDELHGRVLRAARGDAVCRRLMTVPGVGAVVALGYRTAVDDPRRFRHSKALGAHFGLVPRRHQSGERDRSGRISKVGCTLTRALLYEAANVLLSRVTRWSALKAWAMRIAKRHGAKKAKVALARKLAVIMHRMWMDGTEFRWGAAAAA